MAYAKTGKQITAAKAALLRGSAIRPAKVSLKAQNPAKKAKQKIAANTNAPVRVRENPRTREMIG